MKHVNFVDYLFSWSKIIVPIVHISVFLNIFSEQLLVGLPEYLVHVLLWMSYVAQYLPSPSLSFYVSPFLGFQGFSCNQYIWGTQVSL